MVEFSFLQEDQVVLIAYHFYKCCFSIRDARTKRILGYADSIVVTNVTFVVRLSGQRRARRDKEKNVHAFVRGRFQRGLQMLGAGDAPLREAYYNPYTTDGFIDRKTAKLLSGAAMARCEGKRVYYWGHLISY
ncbi:hypothetical protein [Paenibacillus thalictri]|uniref:Uncharacterized protein n=1 Tax=Paenibacillus thalictri TaxID=2527873 RepID=A0A4Q9DYB8_9BACL|nr:hypothetical protein [Paenibacillus thalictri]TBL80848.1 hypothetical protein EYB31_06420 [Paenibacillus thalictri]